jgi:hypothetical protein
VALTLNAYMLYSAVPNFVPRLNNNPSQTAVCTKMQQGLPTWNRKPFAFTQKLVAGVRFELTTFGL